MAQFQIQRRRQRTQGGVHGCFLLGLLHFDFAHKTGGEGSTAGIGSVENKELAAGRRSCLLCEVPDLPSWMFISHRRL